MSREEKVTRAERVRERRKTGQRRHATTRQSMRLPATPLLTPRGVTLEAATRRLRPGERSLRRYQAVAALAEETMLQVSSRRRARLGWWMVVLLLLAGLAGAILLAWTLPEFQVKAITLAGAQRLSVDEVEIVLRLRGTPIFLVQPDQAVQTLRAHFPEIAAASVTVRWPDRLIVTLQEREPLIRWEQEGAYAWVDDQGVIFRPRGEAEGLIVVRASGRPPAGPSSGSDPWSPPPFLSPQLVETIRLLAPHVPPGSTLLYDPKYGLGWADPRGWTVWFGERPDQVDLQLRVYAALVESIRQRDIAPSLINVTYPSAPYYRVGR